MSLAPTRSRPLVLVADDHADTRGMLRTMLTLHEFDVAECADGASALALVKEHHPDVILLDGTLQGLDGLSVALRLREADADSARRVIFVSGDGGAAFERRVRAAGCATFLLKPVNIFELLDSVRRVAAHGQGVLGDANDGR